MAQHFLLSPAARTLSLKAIMRMDDAEAFGVFQRVRFADNGGEPFCPRCGAVKVYALAETPIRWQCAACRKRFSVTSGTLFHSRKLAIREYLAVIALFTGGVKGVAALRMARDMNINPKSAFVMLHKLREAMGAEVHAVAEIGGSGSQVEVDGAYVGGTHRPENRKEDRPNRRGVENPKRRVVAVARERRGRAMPWVVDREADAVSLIRQHVATGTEVHADDAAGWNILHASYDTRRVNHSVEYVAEDGANVNQAESFFSRLRRAEFGIHHRISGQHLQQYANECAWRENNRRQSNGAQWDRITAAALSQPKSQTWAGYWRRSAS